MPIFQTDKTHDAAADFCRLMCSIHFSKGENSQLDGREGEVSIKAVLVSVPLVGFCNEKICDKRWEAFKDATGGTTIPCEGHKSPFSGFDGAQCAVFDDFRHACGIFALQAVFAGRSNGQHGLRLVKRTNHVF